MTFEELDLKYPNAFTDAELLAVSVDYRRSVVTLEMNLRSNPPESPERNVYSRAVLTAFGLYYFTVEAPDRHHLFGPERDRVTVDAFPEDPDRFAPFRQLEGHRTAGTFCCRLFVHDWNSFIHLAAQDAQLRWGEDPANS